MPEYLLGATPAKTDPRTLRLSDYIDGYAPPPISVDNSQVVAGWGALGNTRKGDCVLAAHGHNLQLWTALARVQFSLTEDETLQLYDYLTGGVDRGLVVLDTLNWLRKNVWKGRSILGFAAVDPRDQQLARHAMAMFGSLYRGIGLPASAQRQVGGVWDVSTDAPGSWGWHALIDVAYDSRGAGTQAITWGLIQSATWAFWTRYCSEAYVIIPTDPIPGFDRDAFIRDLKAIGAYTGPDPSPTPTPPPPPPPGPQPIPAPVKYAQSATLTIKYPDGKVQAGTIGFSGGALTRMIRAVRRVVS